MIEVQVQIEGIDGFADGTEKQLSKYLFEAMKEALAFTELVQIRAYTSTGNPSQPSGSDYRRTFTLRGSSKVKVTSKKLPEIRGQWIADPRIAEYAIYVIGPKSRQATVHKGRWKSLEDIADIVEKKLPEIFDKYLSKVE